MSEIKREMTSLLERLPPNVSIEGVQYHLYVIDKIRNGLGSINKEGRLTQEEVEAKLSKWLVS